MTNEERDIITRFIERVGGAQGTGFGSVPGAKPQLPPIDKEADALIGQLFDKYPEAKYRLTQTAFVQEHALAEAQNRLQRMEAELQEARQAAHEAQSQQQRSGGFLGGLFGGGSSRPAAVPQRQGGWNQAGPQGQFPQGQYPQGQYPQGAYAQGGMPQQFAGQQPGMFQRGGSGFLGSALTTAAGVAGGLVVGNALMNMLSPSSASAAGLGGGEAAPAGGEASPWGGGETAGADQNYVDQGSWTQPDAGGDQYAADQGGYSDGGSWDTAASDDGGGWDDNA